MRGIHAHNRPIERARAGERCALNLAGSFPEGGEPRRGDWVIDPALHKPVGRLDLGIAVSRAAPAPLRDGLPVHFHLGTEDVVGRLAVLGRARNRAGRERVCAARSRTPDRGAVGRPRDHPRPCGPPYAGRRSRARSASRRAVSGRGRNGWPRSPRLPNPMPATRSKNWSRRRAWYRWRRSPGRATCRFPKSRRWSRPPVWRASGPERRRSRSAPSVSRNSARGSRRCWPNGTAPSPTRSARHQGRCSRGCAGRRRRRRSTRRWRRRSRPGGSCAMAAMLRLPAHQPRLNREDERLWERVRPLLAADGLRPPRVRELAAELDMEPEKLTRFLRRVERFGRVAPVAPNRFFLPETVRELAELAAALAAESPERQLYRGRVQGPLRHRPQPDDRGARISRPDRRDPAGRRHPDHRARVPPSCSADSVVFSDPAIGDRRTGSA